MEVGHLGHHHFRRLPCPSGNRCVTSLPLAGGAEFVRFMIQLEPGARGMEKGYLASNGPEHRCATVGLESLTRYR